MPNGSVFAANISSDAATGIGAYSDEDLLRALTEGVSKSVMTWVANHLCIFTNAGEGLVRQGKHNMQSGR